MFLAPLAHIVSAHSSSGSSPQPPMAMLQYRTDVRGEALSGLEAVLQACGHLLVDGWTPVLEALRELGLRSGAGSADALAPATASGKAHSNAAIAKDVEAARGLGSRCSARGQASGGGRSAPLRWWVPAAGKRWVAPREPETPPPSHEHVHASCPWSTVSFNYNCVTLRRPRVCIKLLLAQSIIKHSGTSPGCLPSARGAAR